MGVVVGFSIRANGKNTESSISSFVLLMFSYSTF